LRFHLHQSASAHGAVVAAKIRVSTRHRNMGTVSTKKKLDALVYDALFYVESIEAVCARLKVLRTEDEIVQAAVDRVTTREGIQLLKQAVDEMPSRLAEKAKVDDQGLFESKGHTHIRAAVSDRGQFIMGNVGVKSDARHYSRDANFSGDCVVIGGDMSADALAILLRR
jgi:hypothetical protein